MKNIGFIFVLVSLIISFSTVFSQTRDYYLHLGPSFPTSDFAEEDIDNINTEDAGGASIGFGLGLKFIYPLTENGLGLFGGINFNYNGLKDDVEDDMESIFEQQGLNVSSVNHWEYYSVPISVGLNYTLETESNVSLVGEAGLALSILKQSDMVLETNTTETTLGWDMSTSVGTKLGGGILIKDNTSIKINYWGLGEHDMEGEVENQATTTDTEKELNVSYLTLTLGFKL